MPRYEYRCRACGDTFELTRQMSSSSAPAHCPQGHDDTVKLLSTVAVGGRASSSPASGGGGGGDRESGAGAVGALGQAAHIGQERGFDRLGELRFERSSGRDCHLDNA